MRLEISGEAEAVIPSINNPHFCSEIFPFLETAKTRSGDEIRFRLAHSRPQSSSLLHMPGFENGFGSVLRVRVEPVCVCASRATARSRWAHGQFQHGRQDTKQKCLSMSIVALKTLFKSLYICKETYFEKPYKDPALRLQEFAIYETK